MTNIAVLGAGRIGQVHAKAIANDDNAKLVAVADAFPEAANAIAQNYGCAVSTIDEIAADANIDGVIICTPTNTHADLIEQFAHAGKAIFCEKPVDLDVDRVKTCLKVVKETGAKMMIGFNRRFDPHFSAVKDAIDAGKIGDVEMVQITSRDPEGPPLSYVKVSGGIFCDMTIHDFDMARHLMGEEPVSVSAQGSVQVYPEFGEAGDYDSAMATLVTASGKQCSISNSRRATYGYDQRIEVHGSKGMIAAENQREHSIEIANESGFTRPPLLDFFMSRYEKAYSREIAAFVRQIKDGEAPKPDGNDGLQSLILAMAATISAKEGRVVMLSEFA